MIPYKDLEKHFTVPKKGASSFYENDIKIPRKLKKKVKKFCGTVWNGNSNGVRLWYYLESKNNDYKRFLIKQIINENKKIYSNWY